MINNKLLFVVSILFVFISIYILNYYYPLLADDFSYSFIWNSGDVSEVRVRSIYDIFVSQYHHYHLWGGRNITHAIAQFLLMIDFRLACLLNSLVYVGLIYLMCRITILRKDGNACIPFTLFLFYHILLWFCQPAFCIAVLWKTGSANYLWSIFIVLLFIYPFYKHFIQETSKDNLFKSFLLFVSGIIAGWTNENLGISLIFFIVVLLYLCYHKKIKIPKWYISGGIGVITGYCFLFLAPGNFKRSDFIKNQQAELGNSRFDILADVFNTAVNYSIHYIVPLLIILGLFVLVLKRSQSVNSKILIIPSLIFLSTGILSFSVMLVSPVFPTRSLFGSIIFLIIPIGMIYNNINIQINKLYKYIHITSFALIICIFFYDYYRKYNTIKEVHEFFDKRTTYIENQKTRGIKTIVFEEKLKTYHVKYGFEDITWWNKNYARYYGVDSVMVIGIDQKQL